MNKTIFISGGGTGGHLFPAISIGTELIKHNFSIIYIGSEYGIEKKYFNENNLKHYLLNIRGIQRHISLNSIFVNLLFPFRFILSYIKSIMLIIKHKPKAIIGTGGYASGLPLIAGICLKIPIMIQEQNSIPGLITRKLNKRAQKIFLGFKKTEKILNGESIYTGNPIRQNLKNHNKELSKEKLGFNKNKKLILIIGGSQGARAINYYIYDNIHFFKKNDFQVYWQCGFNDLNKISEIKYNEIKITPFIKDISLAYSAADLVLSRAGAISISELSFMKKATIFIPLPTAADNHQEINSNYLKEKNACISINQNDLQKGILQKEILNILENKENIEQLEKNIEQFSNYNSTEKIVNEILKAI
jgi:UDP-N-acetylglucosamine--N-acetylmuramyl-(pentapeptide) pyrophosphoryl-undecaprenol N-acetylglucosamine transferase